MDNSCLRDPQPLVCRDIPPHDSGQAFSPPLLTAQHNLPNGSTDTIALLSGSGPGISMVKQEEENELDECVEFWSQSLVMQEQGARDADQEEDQMSVFQDDQNCEVSAKLRRMILVLVKYADKCQEKLQEQRSKTTEGNSQMAEIFDTLVKKFRRLRKTKQEMTKYCMRKAFKFLADKHKRMLEGRDSADFLREYFEHLDADSFSIPFKKNSEQKTMNTNFLKKVFGSLTFTSDYKQFLKTFDQLVEEDNRRKIYYLTSTIKSFLVAGSLKRLQTVKRLPWTQAILDKTVDLAYKLVTHSPYGVVTYEPRQERFRPKVSVQRKSTSDAVDTPVRKKTTTIVPQISLSPPKTSQRAFRRHDRLYV